MEKLHLAVALVALVAGGLGCDKSQESGSQLDENIERAVEPVHENTGMLGGNMAPVDDDASAGRGVDEDAGPARLMGDAGAP